jgi:hypothetical protein
MKTAYFHNLFTEITKKCLENDITDYKTCYEFHKFKHNDLLLDEVKQRYDMIKSFESIIKNCIDNNKNITECYYSKNKFEYIIPIGYYYEFNHMYNKMKNNKN